MREEENSGRGGVAKGKETLKGRRGGNEVVVESKTFPVNILTLFSLVSGFTCRSRLHIHHGIFIVLKLDSHKRTFPFC